MAASSSDMSNVMSNVVLFSLDMDGALLSSALANLIFKYACTSLPFKQIYDSLPIELQDALSLAPQDLPIKNDDQSMSRDFKARLTQAREATVGLLFDEASKNLSEATKLALKEATKKALEEAHPKLIEHILHCIPDNAIAYFMSGSNRQTRKRDNDNGTRHRTGSSFIALEALVDIITEKLEGRGRAKAFLDKTLLEDLANKQKSGTCFDLALQHGCISDSEEVKIYDTNTALDENKLLLLLLQSQHVASQHDNLPIAVHFYDDDTNPAIEKQILAPQQLFFGHQVKEAIETFLDNCVNEIIFNIKVTECLMHEYQKRGASSAAESTRETPLLSLTSFKDQMINYITQLKNAIFKFKPTDIEAEADLCVALQLFRDNQNDEETKLKDKLNELKTLNPFPNQVYTSAYNIFPSDIIIKISNLLHIFLHDAPNSEVVVPSEKAGGSPVEIILNTLKQEQNPLNDKLPANVTLHLHQYIGPKKPFFSEAEPKEVLLTHKPPIQGGGSIDYDYAENYHWISQKLVNDAFHDAPPQKQPSLCRNVLKMWHRATTKSLLNEEPQSSGETQLPTNEEPQSSGETQLPPSKKKSSFRRRLTHALTHSSSTIFRGSHSHKRADSSKETHEHQRKP